MKKTIKMIRTIRISQVQQVQVPICDSKSGANDNAGAIAGSSTTVGPSASTNEKETNKLLSIHKELMLLGKSCGPAWYDHLVCDDWMDPISQESIWEVNGNGNSIDK